MRDAFIVAAARTAIGKAPKGSLRNTRPDDTAASVMQELFRGIAAEGRGPVPSDTGPPQVLQYCASRLSRKHPGLPPTVLAFPLLYTTLH